MTIKKFYQNHDPIVFYSTLSTFIFFFLTITTFLLTLPNLPQKLPLFYSLAWGENQLATPLQFIIIPLTIFLTLLVNLIISWHLHSSQIILKRILSISSVAISFLLFITVFKIIFLFL